ncbi:MAG: hypothetical protein K6356_16030 [Chloroflexus sp.]
MNAALIHDQPLGVANLIILFIANAAPHPLQFMLRDAYLVKTLVNVDPLAGERVRLILAMFSYPCACVDVVMTSWATRDALSRCARLSSTVGNGVSQW